MARVDQFTCDGCDVTATVSGYVRPFGWAEININSERYTNASKTERDTKRLDLCPLCNKRLEAAISLVTTKGVKP